MMRIRECLAYPLLLAVLSGCGGKSVERAAVQGHVTYRGQPIQDGTILFSPTGRAKGERLEPAGSKIVNGEYHLDGKMGPMVGAQRVEIQAYRKTGRKIPDMLGDVSKPDRPLVDEVIPILPATFNVESTLTADIAPGENTKDFEL
jgi:hypothetical protein